jgi:hypothetical protein
MAHPFWSLKPWWCQPWTILLTGTIGIAGSWLLLQIWWLTTGVALVVVAWWVLFLLIVPNITPVETIVD